MRLGEGFSLIPARGCRGSATGRDLVTVVVALVVVAAAPGKMGAGGIVLIFYHEVTKARSWTNLVATSRLAATNFRFCIYNGHG
jgi:hypothetical protein